MLCRNVSAQFCAITETVDGIIDKLQNINTLLNPLIGKPKSNHGAYDDDVLHLDSLREKLRLQIDKFREVSYDRNVSYAKLNFIAQFNTIIQGQQLRTICLSLKNTGDRDEICEYGRLTTIILQQIAELQRSFEQENEQVENESRERTENSLSVDQTRQGIENARLVFEKFIPLVHSFNGIRNHLDKISNHCCPLYGEPPRVTAGLLDESLTSLDAELKNFETRLNDFNSFLEYKSRQLFESCSEFAAKMDVLITEGEIYTICVHLPEATANQHFDGILLCGKKAKALYEEFSKLRINIGKEMNKLKLEYIVTPNSQLF